MSLNPKWIPMKWPCGPREMSRMDDFHRGNSELRKMVEVWTEPSALQLLRGTPVNCLVVEWATGTADEHAQQQALKPLVRAGRQLGLSFVGTITAEVNAATAAHEARGAGLQAVLVEGGAVQPVDLPVIAAMPNDKIDWDKATPILSATNNIWPKANLKTLDENMDGDTAQAGPTGNPWVDSNGWVSLLTRQMIPEKALWLDVDPPDTVTSLTADDYCLAIADSGVYGSRWIISLDAEMRAALLRKERAAVDTWSRMSQTLEFFEAHQDWDTYEPMGLLAVVSDFRAANAYASAQVLNLLIRRQFQFCVLDRTHPLKPPRPWVKGMLWMDDESPSGAQQEQVVAFVRTGGTFIGAKYWGPTDLKPQRESWLSGYDLYELGQGRFAVADGGLPDPYQIARDVHLLMSRKDDFVRIYNPGTTKSFSSTDRGLRKQVVQVLNYSAEAANYVSLWVHEKTDSARLLQPGPNASMSLQGKTVNDGSTFELPPVRVNCAIEMEVPA